MQVTPGKNYGCTWLEQYGKTRLGRFFQHIEANRIAVQFQFYSTRHFPLCSGY